VNDVMGNSTIIDGERASGQDFSFLDSLSKIKLMNHQDPAFSALRHRDITLHLITEENLPTLLEAVADSEEADDFQYELTHHYAPTYDKEGRRKAWGFYATMNDEVMGFSLLDVDDWENKIGSTGADTLPEHRGKGLAPGSKPHLYYLAFHLLGLNRIETGCLVSNTASRRSLEKTPGIVYEGTFREAEWNEDTEQFEDVVRYAILRRDWEHLYAIDEIEVIS
jgi:ribosomal-protein-serine acetyltransferase